MYFLKLWFHLIDFIRHYSAYIFGELNSDQSIAERKKVLLIDLKKNKINKNKEL